MEVVPKKACSSLSWVGRKRRACKKIIVALFIFTVIFALKDFAAGSQGPIVLMWQVQKDITDGELALLEKAGVNTIQSFALTGWSEEEVQIYLSRAARHRMKVIVYLGTLYDYPAQKFTTHAADFVNRWKDNRTVMAWHIFDEPKEASKRVDKISQERAYDSIKSLDPSRPVMISINYTRQSDYEMYYSENAFDLLDLHAYVNPNISARQLTILTLLKNNKRRNFPLIITLRAFNGSGWRDLGEGSLKGQYDFFMRKQKVTDNVGFYGWGLSPNSGLKNVKYLLNQFVDLTGIHIRQRDCPNESYYTAGSTHADFFTKNSSSILRDIHCDNKSWQDK